MTKQTGPTVINYIRTKNCNRGTAMEHSAEKQKQKNKTKKNKKKTNNKKQKKQKQTNKKTNKKNKTTTTTTTTKKHYLVALNYCSFVLSLFDPHLVFFLVRREVLASWMWPLLANFIFSFSPSKHCKICVYSAEEWNTSATALYIEIYVIVNIRTL